MKAGREGIEATLSVSVQGAPLLDRDRLPPVGDLPADRQDNPCCGHLTGEEAGSSPVADGVALGENSSGAKPRNARRGGGTFQMAAAVGGARGLLDCPFFRIGKAAMGDEGEC